MTPELSAYLERLVHPARKAYATACAEHLLDGSTAPRVPLGMESDTAAKIARKVKRYAASSTATRAAAPEVSVQPAAAPTPPLPDGLQHLPEAVRAYAAEHEDTELLGLVDAFTAPGEVAPQVDAASMERSEDAAGISEHERLSDHYAPEVTPAFVETAEVDVLDLTDLEADHARTLALKLARWNGGGRVYSYRNGRRYLNRTVRRIDLNDPTVQALPNYSDLLGVVSERGIARA